MCLQGFVSNVGAEEPRVMKVAAMEVRDQAVAGASYQAHVNPQWVRLLNLLEMNARYVECRGERLRTSQGRTILHFLSGYCVYNIGHNHPHLISPLHQEPDRHRPAFSHP